MDILFTADGLDDVSFEMHHADAKSLLRLLDVRSKSEGLGTLDPEDVMERVGSAVRKVAVLPSGFCRSNLLEKLSDMELLAEASHLAGIPIRYS